nr:PAS domain-containing protein [Nitrospinaceae bacterium]NIR55930.1 PAS domain-containing protein [Nitrospinaceae bacterium]NIS86381.1 PAS domain-containing protein [Nitrospinaceae bacterium]NIT83210.1 PAS domain-containing protein [Nitrospinaceae bacterium]NIU45424.1 PAS domain-containing protein [Nitrospinaceae bacterium]
MSPTAKATDNQSFEHIFSSFIDGVLLVSNEGHIVQSNPAMEEMFRVSRETFLDKPVTEMFPDQPEISGKIQETLSAGNSFRDIHCQGFRKLSQSTFPVSITLSPYLNGGGPQQGVVMLIRDMSLFNELEESSRRLDHISNLGALSLGMAHEIKNPLVAISGSAQLLRSRLPDKHHKFLDVVIKESERINRMVNRMLDFARPNPLELKMLNIHQVLGEILLLEPIGEQENLQLVQDYDPSLPNVVGDEDQLKQVFLNLIRNALEAMPEGGVLEIRTRIHSKYTVKTESHPGSRQGILVEVQDSGPGMDAEQLKQIFTPFHTTKSKGSGLGLPLSLKIIEDHQGILKVNSEPGQGTQVRVFLPIEQ